MVMKMFNCLFKTYKIQLRNRSTRRVVKVVKKRFWVWNDEQDATKYFDNMIWNMNALASHNKRVYYQKTEMKRCK